MILMEFNKIGILCCIKYEYANKTIIPIKITISKHNQDYNLIKDLKKNDSLYIKLIAYKFTKNSNYIDSIANIISESEILILSFFILNFYKKKIPSL